MPCGECRQDYDPYFIRGAFPDHILARLEGIDISDPASSEQIRAANLKLPPTKSHEEVTSEASERSQKLLASYSHLRSIVERHEATIQKRWVSRTRQKRSDILEAAWPGMAVAHRPDFDIFFKEQSKHNHSIHEISTVHREHFMWPYINQEDLSKPRPLLLLLNARGRRHPSEFAAFDNETMRLGKALKTIVPFLLDGYVMLLNGVENDSKYGSVLSVSDHTEWVDYLLSGKQMDPGEGLLVLEAQQHLLEFLVKCCHTILQDIALESLTTNAFPIQPELQLRAESDGRGFSSLSALAADAPYKLPSQLDMGRIESLLGAQVSALEDHLLSLREDPAYFAQQVADIKDHHHELIRCPRNCPCYRRTRQSKTQIWKDIIEALFIETYYDLEVFSQLWHQAQYLKAMHARYHASITPAKDLPAVFQARLVLFFFHLTQSAREPLCQLYHEAFASPPVRKYQASQRRKNANTSRPKNMIVGAVTVNPCGFQGRLFWLLKVLGEDSRQLTFIGLSVVVDELEQLLQAEPRAQELVSSRIAGMLGKISVISQCLNQIESYRPWSTRLRYMLKEKHCTLHEEFVAARQPLSELMKASHNNDLSKIARFDKITEGKFSYPAGKRRTKANVEAMQQAERNLDAFWASADLILSGVKLASIKVLKLQDRTWERTPDWVEPLSPRQANKTVSPDTDNLDRSLLQLSNNINWQHEESSTKQDLIQPKVKVKTKGHPHKIPPAAKTANEDNEEVDLNTGPDADPVKIPVDARALKVFRALFFDPEVTSTPGEVSWSDFLHAMISIGFAAEKLYGSAWQFQSEGADRDTIQFHEPHPRKKIPFNTARRHGRRLNKAFGWDNTTFKLKEKVKH